MKPVAKLDSQRWETVADLARWLLTHADEYDSAIVVLRQANDEGDRDVVTHACPCQPIVEILGAMELAKTVYVRQAEEATWGTTG